MLNSVPVQLQAMKLYSLVVAHWLILYAAYYSMKLRAHHLVSSAHQTPTLCRVLSNNLVNRLHSGCSTDLRQTVLYVKWIFHCKPVSLRFRSVKPSFNSWEFDSPRLNRALTAMLKRVTSLRRWTDKRSRMYTSIGSFFLFLCWQLHVD